MFFFCLFHLNRLNIKSEEIMQPFTKRVIEIIKEIPEGKVMSYGQIASIAGSKRGARQVSRILHSMSKKYELPWHRVLNKQGKIVIKGEEGARTQRYMLEAEGVSVSESGTIDLRKYQYNPKENPVDLI